VARDGVGEHVDVHAVDAFVDVEIPDRRPGDNGKGDPSRRKHEAL